MVQVVEHVTFICVRNALSTGNRKLTKELVNSQAGLIIAGLIQLKISDSVLSNI